MNPRRFGHLALALLTVASAACASTPPVDAGPGYFEGRYEDLTQPDWPLALTLDADGNATLEYTWWQGSSPGNALRRTRGTWEQRGAQLVVRYGAVSDTFEFRPRLDVDGAKGRGKRPALVAVEPVHRKSVIGASKLWRVEPAR